jgi:hypothetical protein
MEVLLVIGFASGGVLGYWLRCYVEERRQKERERVVGALGAVPQWEVVARGLEAAALEQAQQGRPTTAGALLQQARDTRDHARRG